MLDHAPVRWREGFGLVALCVAAAACDLIDGPEIGDCGEIKVPRNTYGSKVYGGTVEPTAMPLAPEQIRAIGSLGMCSGTLIAPRWVLTARHCPLEPGDAFCIGREHDRPNVCIQARQITPHPSLDLALIELDEDATRQMGGVTPIPVLDELMECDRLGQTAEAAGYGTTPTTEFGARFFTAEPIVGLWHDSLVVHGHWARGLCRGDSGGPVMVVASDGSVRVAGALSSGDPSCRGRDVFTRTDMVSDWIADFTDGNASPQGERL
jgi:hypothetical protein